MEPRASGKIERIELFHVEVPLPTPFFPVWIPGYPQHHQRFTLLRVTTRDGLIGHASGLAFDRERASVGDLIGPFLVGLDPYDVDAARERLRQSAILGWSNAWMEIAFWDLAAQARGLPVHALIAERLEAKGPTPTSIDAYASFGELRPAAARAEAIERAARLGFRGAKICVHAEDEAEDLAQLRAARRAAGDDFALMVHAQQTSSVSLVEEVARWDLSRAKRFARAAAEARITWLQEPLLSDSVELLAELSANSAVPIAGGDTLTSPVLLRAMAAQGCYRVLTPDVSIFGLGGTTSLLAHAQKHGFGFSARTYGDGLALQASLHAMAAWSRASGERGWLEFPWEPPAIIPEQRDALLETPIHAAVDGTVAVPSAPGLGVSIHPKALRKFATRFYNLTPVRFVVASARRAGLRQTAAVAQPGRTKVRRRSVSGAS